MTLCPDTLAGNSLGTDDRLFLRWAHLRGTVSIDGCFAAIVKTVNGIIASSSAFGVLLRTNIEQASLFGELALCILYVYKLSLIDNSVYP